MTNVSEFIYFLKNNKKKNIEKNHGKIFVLNQHLFNID
jgi:hypothetical protein